MTSAAVRRMINYNILLIPKSFSASKSNLNVQQDPQLPWSLTWLTIPSFLQSFCKHTRKKEYAKMTHAYKIKESLQWWFNHIWKASCVTWQEIQLIQQVCQCHILLLCNAISIYSVTWSDIHIILFQSQFPCTGSHFPKCALFSWRLKFINYTKWSSNR